MRTSFAQGYSYVGPWTDLANNSVIPGGTHSFTALRIPAGYTVYYQDSTTLSALYILVEGSIVGVRPTTPGASGPSVTLDATSGLDVEGRVSGGDGANGSPSTSNGPNATGTSGGDGGSVTLKLGPLNTITIGPTAVVASGAGGTGGAAEVGRNASGMTQLAAQGGAGGSGGSLRVLADHVDAGGMLILGSGGDGGPATVGAPDTNSTTTAGSGGPVGPISLPSGTTPLGLWQAGHLTGAKRGGGGSATSDAACPNGVCACITTCQQNGAPDKHVGSPGSNGADATQALVTGGSGARGARADATGGNGGPNCVLVQTSDACFALDGGLGGNAQAFGGNGGNGGRGGNGVTSSASDPIRGGRGGLGGDGGDASARAGSGGCDSLGRCNDPGHAWALSKAGSGGSGGNGGWSTALSNPISDSCRDGPTSECFVSVQFCGHAGHGASGGVPGALSAQSPGGPPFQHLIPTTGNAGADGTYDASVCDHSQQHSHTP